MAWNPRSACRNRWSASPECALHSYSVPLRPDIALSIPDGPNSGLHLFDAKFRVQGLADAELSGSDKDGDDDKAGERAGTFKRGDIHKVHAYRDSGCAIGVDPVPGWVQTSCFNYLTYPR